jgi:hypothetical protein
MRSVKDKKSEEILSLSTNITLFFVDMWTDHAAKD